MYKRQLFSQIAEESIAEELLDILIQEVEAIETRINIVTNQARLNIKPDSNSMEIELPYVLKQSGLTSLYKQRISI